MNKTTGIILAAVLVVGLLWFAAANDNGAGNSASVLSGTSNSNENGATNGQTATDPLSDGNRVLISPVSPGTSVTISSAALTQPGYIVLYRAEEDGETKIVGHTGLLARGGYNNIRITLTERVEEGQSITAALHADDGDGTYEVPGADAYLGNPGAPIVNDVDVVGVSNTFEAGELEEQVETYLDDTATTAN